MIAPRRSEAGVRDAARRVYSAPADVKRDGLWLVLVRYPGLNYGDNLPSRV